MKTVLSRLLTIALLPALWFAEPLSSLAFADVNASTPYGEAISALEESGVIGGYNDGTFRPSATINRAEFLKIVLEAREDGGSFAGANCFPDVQHEWFAAYVCTAQEEGIVSGYSDGLFRPEQTINAVEAGKMIALSFKQDIQGDSSVWYEPYLRALESAKAIPPSITGLDRAITRGEMAEMIWRLKEGITDQPSIGYLNVKYPSIAVNFAEDVPQQARSCADITALAGETQNTYDGGREMMRTTGMPAMAPTAGESADASDFSQTNVQVEGVDEGDIVKTDGTYLYSISGNTVRIVDAVPANELREIGTIIFSSSDAFTPTDLYITDGTLVVLGTKQTTVLPMTDRRIMPQIWPYPSSMQRTEARIYSVSNPAHPSLSRRVTIDGSLASSRRISNRLYLVLSSPMLLRDPIPLAGSEDSTVLPRYTDTQIASSDRAVARCMDVTILPHIPSPEFITVATIPLTASSEDVHREVIVGSAENVYASLDNLYVAQTQWLYDWTRSGGSRERTNIFRFAFTDDGVDFESKGSVEGHVLNQFSMDEYDDSFRIATTSGNSWDQSNPSMNNLFVLSLSLEPLGSVEDIAPGEQITSVRFLSERAYMVTFQKIDPFFVLDLSDPANPEILGKLKIPGFSDYLHPYDATHILGFGKEAVEAKEGSFAWYQGMKVALFDVSDVSNPRELFRTVIGDRGTGSPLLQNHKALLFDKDRDLLSFPVTVYQIPESQKASGEASAYGSPVFQGAYVYRLTLEKGFELLGTLSHYAADTFLKAGDYWYNGGKDIERIVRIGDSLYTVSQSEVESFAFPSLETVGSAVFRMEPGMEDVKY
ncbi:MAG: beta-propeller domain-containing protein [Candidatus Peregrinibacteria bacterium]